MSTTDIPAKPGSEDWKNLKLSLERPYKDDVGEKIPEVEDIVPDGTYIYEPKVSADERLKTNLHRIFQERGFDFFEKPEKRITQGQQTPQEPKSDDEDAEEVEEEARPKPMTYDELHAMRSELLPQLYVALGEITQARDILGSLLSTTHPKPFSKELPAPALSAAVVSKLPPIPSLQTFNSQITISSKDEALRKAADLFNSVSERMERTHNRSEKYWINALKIRRSNWRMIPAPLPNGSAMGKGADRTAKDFLVLYGLEESSPLIRRRGIAHLSDINDECQLVFSQRQNMLMKVTLTYHETNRNKANSSTNSPPVPPDPELLTDTLREAQLELIDEEIFSAIIKDASNLPTALARVSERLIVIDASQGVELKFELASGLFVKGQPLFPEKVSPTCDLIYHTLHVLLSRRHAYHKTERLNASGNFPASAPVGYSPPMLQPIIDFLQYKVFCDRLQTELTRASKALNVIGIPTDVVFDAVGETGKELVHILSESRPRQPSGEAIIKIDNRHSLRLTFVAPSNLTAHLTQATLQVYSLPQLSQLLTTEIERFILQRICHLGERLKGGTWFIDLDHLVARWEGFVFTFHITFGTDMKINCSAFRVDNKTGRRGNLFQYSELNNIPFLAWVQDIIQKSS